MTPNPFAGLLHSRKFWLMILDVLVSGAAYFIPKYVAPAVATDALWLIAAIQPVFVTVIGAVAYEDKAKIEADVQVKTSQASIVQARIENK
jgi:hypothetical protein